jgi:hypothetical protein
MSLKNCKAKGSRNERRSIRLLEAAGYACTRAAASLGACLWTSSTVSRQIHPKGNHGIMRVCKDVKTSILVQI